MAVLPITNTQPLAQCLDSCPSVEYLLNKGINIYSYLLILLVYLPL